MQRRIQRQNTQQPKRLEEAAVRTQRKEENDAYETNNRNDMLAVFEDALKKGTDVILLLSDARMRLYICYYFQ